MTIETLIPPVDPIRPLTDRYEFARSRLNGKLMTDLEETGSAYIEILEEDRGPLRAIASVARQVLDNLGQSVCERGTYPPGEDALEGGPVCDCPGCALWFTVKHYEAIRDGRVIEREED